MAPPLASIPLVTPAIPKSPRFLIARWLYFPLQGLFTAFIGSYLLAIQESRRHDEDVRKTYRRLQEFYPYTHQKQWRRWVKSDVGKHPWWRFFIGPTYTEETLFPPEEVKNIGFFSW